MSYIVYNNKLINFNNKLVYKNAPSIGPLTFTVTTSEIYTQIKLPIINSNQRFNKGTKTNYGKNPTTYLFDFVADWGDGETSGQITDAEDSGATHTYDDPGTYEIKLTGLVESFVTGKLNYYPQYIRPYITSISSWGDTGLRQISFDRCELLESLPTDGSKVIGIELSNVNDHGYSIFYNCSSLTSIPHDIFKYSPDIGSLNDAFAYCTSLTSIPVGLLDYTSILTDISGIFKGCTSLTTIPENLFDNNININNCENAFNNCGNITSNVPTLWVDFPTATHNTGTFGGCVNANNYVSIPTGWK